MTQDDDLVTTAAQFYDFRRRLRTETAAAYRVALITHVEQRDWAAAHELRLGKPQAEWTSAESAAFKDRLLAMPRARQEFRPGQSPIVFPAIVTPPGSEAVTEANLLDLASLGLQSLIDHRRSDPAWETPIFISALLTTGSLMTTTSARGDRIAVLKFFARHAPVFGYFVGFDSFVHHISDKDGAQKQEAMLMHIGTRELRIVRVAPYTRPSGGILFADPYDISSAAISEDPYAEIFVSVPPSTGGPH